MKKLSLFLVFLFVLGIFPAFNISATGEEIVEVSNYASTTIEFEDYYLDFPVVGGDTTLVVDDDNASAKKLVNCWYGIRPANDASVSFDIVVGETGGFDIDYAIGYLHDNSCRLKILIDGVEIGQNDDTYLNYVVSESYPTTYYPLALYRKSRYRLTAGTHTVTLKVEVAGSGTSSSHKFSADYIKFTPTGVETPTYLVKDFENGAVGNKGTNAYSLTDGAGVSKYALAVPDGSNVPEFSFYLRSRTTYDESWSYDASVWIKADSAVTNDTVSLVFTLKTQGSSWPLPETLEKKISVQNAGLKQGEWVKVNVPEFTYDGKVTYLGREYSASGKNGSVKVVLGNNIPYTMDDLVIMPNRYAPIQTDTVNPVLPKPLDSVSDPVLDEGYEYWTVWDPGCDGTLDSTTVGTKVALTNGETATLGKVANIKHYQSDVGLTVGPLKLKYGLTYTLEFLAKANNTQAQSTKPAPVITWYKNQEKPVNFEGVQHQEFFVPANEEDKNVGTNLSSEWALYRTTFISDCVTNLEAIPGGMEIRLRDTVDTENKTNAAAAEWSIANVRIYQTEPGDYPNLVPSISFTGKKVGDGVISVESKTCVTRGQVSNTISRILVPFNGDYVIYKSFDDWKNEDSFIADESAFAGAKISVVATDRDDYFGSEIVRPLERLEEDFTAVAEFNQVVWAKDMPTLSATVKYKNAEENDTLLAICAQYGPYNQMISCDTKPIVLSAGEHEAKLTITTTPEAEIAKIFLWKNDSLAPKREDVVELTKTTEGTFIYVDAVKGTDNTTYGYKNPVKTVEQAISATTSIMESDDKTDVYVILLSGTHKTGGLKITGAMTDASKQVTFMSYDKSDKAVISGGENISGGFVSYGKGIYYKKIPAGAESRELYVNDVKATKARSRELGLNEFTNTTTYDQMWLKTLGDLVTSSSELVSIADYEKIEDLEFVFVRGWTMYRCQASDIESNANGSITVKFNDPSWKWANSTLDMHVTTPLYMENALELLDEPGEWYLDSTLGRVYYMPREGEDINSAEVILPLLDNDKKPLLDVLGTKAKAVTNLTFNAIEFAHTTWTRTNTEVGYVPDQNHILYDQDPNYNAGSERGKGPVAEGAIDLEYTDNVDFNNCVFTKMGSNAVRLYKDVKNTDIIGCEMYEISASAITIGENDNRTNNMRTMSNITDINILNNYIHHVSQDYWGASAITVFFPKNTTISHNEIAYFPYSGLHLGWGWQTTDENSLSNLKVTNNYIHDLFQGQMYDGGAIYTLGRTFDTEGTHSVISGNFIEDVGAKGSFIYNDTGSANYIVENNVMDSRSGWGCYDRNFPTIWHQPPRTFQIGSSDQAFDHNMIWRNNYQSEAKHSIGSGAYNDETNYAEVPIQFGSSGTWSAEAQAIIDNAGIQDEYKGNFRHGLQEIRVAKTAEISLGDAISGKPEYVTGKNVLYDENLPCTITSSDTGVISVSGNTITAVGKGTATVTYSVVENGMLISAKTEFTVK